MLLAGLDIGTTGCKITLYDQSGKYLGRVYQDYPVSRTVSEHEVDAGLIWRAVRQVLAKAAAAYPGIAGIGVASFGETFVWLDQYDQPLCASMLYTDPRGEKECASLCGRFGWDTLAAISGVNPHPMYSISKLMWMKENRPEYYQKTKRIFLMGDYIAFKLTGEALIDYSLASRTMAFDIQRMQWSEEIFDAADIDSKLFSNPVPTGTCAGPLRSRLAEEWGLSPRTQVVLAGHDQVAAAVGSGVFDENIAVDGAGTVECITPVFSSIPADNRLARSSYTIVPYAEPGKYVCYAFSFTGGALIGWYLDLLSNEGIQGGRDKNLYERLEGDTLPSGPTGLLVLPHFAGAGTPYMDSGAKGAIIGLTITSNRREIYYGIMEGVCYEMRLNMQRLNEAGILFSRLRATGGGAKSKVWMQMKADVLGIPVTSLHSAEAGATGSAMMAGVAAGLFADLRSAAECMVAERETYYPREDVHQHYLEVYERYEKLYEAVRPLV